MDSKPDKNVDLEQVRTDRAVGAFLGAVIGDALGWPQERPDSRIGQKHSKVSLAFQAWKRRSGSRFNAYEEVIDAGEYSDDSQLLLAIGRSVTYGKNWVHHFINWELPVWLLYQRGAGSSVLMTARSWSSSVSPWRAEKEIVLRYFQTGANGAAMRILPHVLYVRDSIDEMLKQVMLSSTLTHGHPRAILGALVYAFALRFMLTRDSGLGFGELVNYLLDHQEVWSPIRPWGPQYKEWIGVADTSHAGGYKSIWDNTVEEVVSGLNECRKSIDMGALTSPQQYLEKIGGFNRQTSGSGVVAALSAIYLASVYAVDPVTGLLEASYAYGADTDTIASMTGALLGALLGTEWLVPEWSKVQDRSYITNLASQIFAGTAASNDCIQERSSWKPSDTTKLLDRLDVLELENSICLGPLGRVKLMKRFENHPLTRSWEHFCWQLVSENGQTIYVRKTAKRQKQVEPEERASAPASLNKMPKSHKLSEIFRGLGKVSPVFIPPDKLFDLVADIAEIIEKDLSQITKEQFLEKLQDQKYRSELTEQLKKKGYTLEQSDIDALILSLGNQVVSQG